MSKTEQEGKLLQRRRLRAGRLLLKSVAQAEVARRVGVTRTTADAADMDFVGGSRYVGENGNLALDNITLRIWET
jgi:hypothetical protein